MMFVMNKLLLLFFVSLLFSSYAYPHDKFKGQIHCKRLDNLIWIFKIDEERKEVYVKHNDNDLKLINDLDRIRTQLRNFIAYTFSSKNDEFYFQKWWGERQHYFLLDRYSGTFVEIMRVKNSSGQIKLTGNCVKKEMVF